MLIDTSVLIATMNADEARHAECVAALAASATERALLPTTILAEAMSLARQRYGLTAQRRLWAGLLSSAIETVAVDSAALARARSIDEQYADVGFGFADATLLACVEELRVARVLSLDRRLACYRPTFAETLQVIP